MPVAVERANGGEWVMTRVARPYPAAPIAAVKTNGQSAAVQECLR